MSSHLISLCYQTELSDDFISDDLEWMDDIEPLDEFFSWLKCCVSDRNCTNSEEIKTYKILLESGHFDDVEEHTDHLSDNIDVYPYNQDLEVLEDIYRQTQFRLANQELLFNILKTQLKTIDHNKLATKVDHLLDHQVRKINGLIAGEYRRGALTVASKLEQLNSNLKKVLETGNSSNLVCLTPMNTFLHLLNYLKLYVTKLIESIQTESKKQPNNPATTESSVGCHEKNLERVFDECVYLKASSVELEAKIKGIAAMCEVLEHFDPALVTHNSDDADPVMIDELYKICFNHVRTAFVSFEDRINKDKLIEKRELLSALNNIKKAARPLMLCCDTIVSLIKNEWKWIRLSGALLSESLESLKDTQLRNEQGYKQLRNIRATQELSSATTSVSDISLGFIKRFASCCDISGGSHNDFASTAISECSGNLPFIRNCGKQIRNIRAAHDQSSATNSVSDISLGFMKRYTSSCDISGGSYNDSAFTAISECRDKKTFVNVMSRMFSGRLDSAFKTIKSFSDDVLNTLSHTEMFYNYIFNGASATMPLETDLILSITRISTDVKKKKQELEKLDCRRFEIEMSQ